MPRSQTISPDHPTTDAAKDRLGFGAIAEHLGKAFLANDLSDGFVVGFEGPWGSGKTSLVGMAFEYLRRAENAPGVIAFQPWLVGSRAELLGELFSLIGAEAQRQKPDNSEDTQALLKRFADVASGLGTLVGALGEADVPGAAWLGKLLKGAGKKASALADKSLTQIKDQLKERIGALPRPIIIFIDDLDRLDPAEAVEVLRLVRAVADFPNIAYVLAYDPEVLAHNLERSLGLKDGRAYLEKIVQASFRVPMPMSYDLSNWFADEVAHIFPHKQTVSDPDDRFATALYRWCPLFLHTPRDVVRALNAIRLYGLPMVDRIDPADLVFLQLVRLKMPKLHEWIEGYAYDLSALGDWGSLKPDAGDRAGRGLLEALAQMPDHKADILAGISDHLPGVPRYVQNAFDDGLKVFQHISQHDREKAIKYRRIASPEHYRLYFAFSETAGVVTERSIAAFLALCESDLDAAKVDFIRKVATPRPQGGSIGKAFLDRLSVIEDLPPASILNLLMALSAGMDGLATKVDEFGGRFFLGNYRGTPFGLLRFVSGHQRIDFLAKFFAECPSLAWLTGIMRSATFDHGYYGDRAKPTTERLLSEDEFEAIRIAYLKRVSTAPAQTIRATPDFGSLLFAWSQGGDPGGARAWVLEQSKSDEGFVDLLERIQGKGYSSNGSYYRLDAGTLSAFFDGAEAVTTRLSLIGSVSPDLQHRADILKRAVSAGTEF
jgi:hypothetical protein